MNGWPPGTLVFGYGMGLVAAAKVFSADHAFIAGLLSMVGGLGVYLIAYIAEKSGEDDG